MQSAIACRVSGKMEVNKEDFLCVIMFCVANLCQESLRRTLTFSLSLQHSPKEFLFDCLKSTFFSWQRPLWAFFSSFLHFFNLHLFAHPYLETGAHLHLYRKMHCMERIFISCRFFQIQFWWVLQRQASSCTAVIAALFSCLWSEWEMTVADACGKHS